MILNIFVKNFRSFKHEVTFSMVAESSKSKEQNVFIQPLAKEDNVRLLNSASIYGANASGKSNLLRALFYIIRFVTRNQPTAGEAISEYDPFQFDESTANSPIEFAIEFVGKDNVKYRYVLHFNSNEIIKEELSYWPNNKPVFLFKRVSDSNIESLIHTAQLGSSLKNTEFEVFKNQTFLSRFGKDIPNDIISNVYIYLKKISIINACSFPMMEKAKDEVNKKITVDAKYEEAINQLIKSADTGLEGVYVKKIDETEFKFPDTVPSEEKDTIMRRNSYSMFGIHPFYSKSKFVRNIHLPFKEESNGTRNLYALGGKILDVLSKGEVLFIDELETSFHPHLAKLLISFFHDKRFNSKNAQLIFTTHDTNLLDRTIFRKDQIWFTEKNELGVTDLFSLQDFNDVREDTPFDKWYLAGKFGGIPNLKSLESFFI